MTVTSPTTPIPYPFERVEAAEPPPILQVLKDPDHRVSLARMPTGDLAYVVTRYEDVRFVMSDLRFSNNRNRPGAPRPVAMTRDDSMVGMDPPDHTRLRRLVSQAFTFRRVQKLRPSIKATVDELLDAMVEAGPPVDLNEAIAVPMPVTVICDLLGVPWVDRPKLRDLANHMVNLTKYTWQEMNDARARMRGYMAELIAAKRADPGEDLLSALIAARDEDDRLSEHELVSQAMLLMVAGHETTVNQIGTSVVTLLRHPEQIPAFRDPARVDAAVEEVLRYDAPGDNGQFRIALEDVEVGGVVIPAGSAVLAMIQTANHDPRRFDDADRFDLGRGANPHIAFGHGVHFCLGAALVRAELQILFPELFRRFPGLRLAVPLSDLRWRAGLRLSGYAAVPVTW